MRVRQYPTVEDITLPFITLKEMTTQNHRVLVGRSIKVMQMAQGGLFVFHVFYISQFEDGKEKRLLNVT